MRTCLILPLEKPVGIGHVRLWLPLLNWTWVSTFRKVEACSHLNTSWPWGRGPDLDSWHDNSVGTEFTPSLCGPNSHLNVRDNQAWLDGWVGCLLKCLTYLLITYSSWKIGLYRTTFWHSHSVSWAVLLSEEWSSLEIKTWMHHLRYINWWWIQIFEVTTYRYKVYYMYCLATNGLQCPLDNNFLRITRRLPQGHSYLERISLVHNF